ncbi:MAG: acetyltransferase, partial [Mucinivorans sp.]
MGWWLVRTKLICRQARLIRFPLDLRNRRYIDFGIGLTTGVGCRLEAYSDDGTKTLHFGSHVQINDYVHICAMKNVGIGNNVLMAG